MVLGRGENARRQSRRREGGAPTVDEGNRGARRLPAWLPALALVLALPFGCGEASTPDVLGIRLDADHPCTLLSPGAASYVLGVELTSREKRYPLGYMACEYPTAERPPARPGPAKPLLIRTQTMATPLAEIAAEEGWTPLSLGVPAYTRPTGKVPGAHVITEVGDVFILITVEAGPNSAELATAVLKAILAGGP